MTFQNVGEISHVAVVERWSWWQGAVADPSKIGTSALPIHPGEYELGYFRTRRKNSSWEPVGIYPDDNGVVGGYRNNKPVDDIAELFQWSCRNPITHEAYVKAIAGGGFDDEPPAPIGDNSGDTDPFEALRIEFLGEKEQAEEILRDGIRTQDDADRASIWKDRMLGIRSRAEAQFKIEKQPSLDESRRIEDKWRPLAHKTDSETTEMAEKLRKGMEPFLQEKKRAEEDRQRKAREAAAEAQREAREAYVAAEKAKAKEIAAGIADAAAIAEHNRRQAEAAKAAEDAAEKARQAERDAEARKVSAGRTGARTSIRVEKKGEIVDYDVFVMAVRNRDEVKELMQSLANRAAKSGFQVDGMKIVDNEKVV